MNILESEDVILDYEIIEDEVFVKIASPMSKDNYISFIAGIYR